MIRRVVAGLLVAFAPSLVLAACAKGATTVFSCLASRGQRIEVCDTGRHLTYSYGVPGRKAEVFVRAARERASTRQGRVDGSRRTFSVQVPGGTTVYDVFWGVNVVDGRREEAGGVTLVVEGREEASLFCAAGKPIVQQMEGIRLRELAP